MDRRISDGSSTDQNVIENNVLWKIRRSSVGLRRTAGASGEGERSEANSSPRAPSVLPSLGKWKNDGSRTNCFEKEIWILCFLIRRCFFRVVGVQVVVSYGAQLNNFFDPSVTDGAPTDLDG